MVAVLGFSKDQVTEAVQAMYAAVARAPEQGFHFPVGREACLAVGYPEEEIDRLPEAAVASFAGVGYPFRADAIGQGDTVLDIGAGSGTDTLIAGRRAGPAGLVHALDITPAMLDRLEETLRQAGIGNVKLLHGDAERIPLPDNSVDVVTTNGVLNLVPDKRRAFAEIFRVLKPDGRVQIADIVIDRPVPLGGRSDPELWAECVVGASVDEDYLALFRETGFEAVTVLREHDYFAASPSADTRRIASGLGARTMEIAMRRRAEAPGRLTRLAHRLHPRRLKSVSGRGLWGAAAAVGAVLACYGTMVLLPLLALAGVAAAPDPGLWVGAILAFTALALIATCYNLRRHGSPWPLALAALGAAAIGYAMLVSYNAGIEAFGFAALLGAVALDLYTLYRAELC
ncbi:MAG TPA: MerC family mercury resistance protein [Afifellaceae bacterium]|nr:MerC family mercury resistance protein [Afifellaceae bacterium]